VGGQAEPAGRKLKDVQTIQTLLVAGILATSSLASAQQIPQGRADVGAIVFKQCMGCHQVGTNARNGIGPVLNGVVGRPAGVYPGYTYSLANKSSGLIWDEQTLRSYLGAPNEVVPGTKMIFFGLKKGQDAADVIAYLKQFDASGKRSSQRAAQRIAPRTIEAIWGRR
jgi:cytochrome c